MGVPLSPLEDRGLDVDGGRRDKAGKVKGKKQVLSFFENVWKRDNCSLLRQKRIGIEGSVSNAVGEQRMMGE